MQRPDEVFARDKCSWGWEIIESFTYGLIHVCSLKAAGSLLPSTGCGSGPQQGLIYPQEGEICLSRTGNEISQNPHGLLMWKACSTSSIQPALRAAVVIPCMAFACTLPCYQNALFLTPAKSHTSVGNMAHAPWQRAQPRFRQPGAAPQLHPTSLGMYAERDAILQKTRQDETTRSFCLSFQDYKPRERHAHKPHAYNH